ncbi:MAG TPA: plastocyanin/azurin family copper-binding protein, partial [Xanthobacteraceae bacterium]|nr:plastocyanin/azurin family copper-binding protein [Xanthobacteraceae bacterium]
RFILRNNGALDHEFLLASAEDNLKHADAMRKNLDMAHSEANARQIKPGKTDEIVWRFTNAGEFEFACLIPGHREAGMLGKVVVK